MESRKYLDRLIYLAYLGAIVGMVYAVYRFLLPALFPFLMALVFASQLKNLTAFIEHHSGASRRVAAAASVFCFYGVLLFFIYLLGTYGYRLVTSFIGKLPDIYTGVLSPGLEQAQRAIETRLIDIDPELSGRVGDIFGALIGWLGNFVASFSSSVLTYLSGILGKLPEVLLGTLFAVVLTFLVTIDYGHITGFILRQIPRDYRSTLVDIKHFLFQTLVSLLKAYTLILGINFAVLAVGLMLLGIGGSFRLAAVIALMDILPILGSGMVFIPWAIYCFFAGRVKLGVGLLLLFAVVELVRNLVEPHVVGDQIGLHPVATLVAAFVGFKFMGLLGLVIAPMLALTVKYLTENGIIRFYK